MQTLDVDLKLEARILACGILAFRDKEGRWPSGRDVNQMNGYKNATNKTKLIGWMERHHWLQIDDATSPSGRAMRLYSLTEVARIAVSPPAPRPSERPNAALPDDDIESRIYGWLWGFYVRHGRWPNGVERARIFRGKYGMMYSKALRRRTFDNMVENGTLVRVIYRNQKGDSTIYVIPEIAPEYVDKHDWIFYNAPPVAS